MYILRPDEKTTPVMVYSRDAVVRGDAVAKENVLRVNIWLRTDGVPEYIHVLKPQVIVFGGTPVKPLTFSETYFPTSQLIGFHTLPPSDEPLDYDPDEANRMMQNVEVLMGTFTVKAKIRISTQTELAANLEVAGHTWMSLYDVEIANPYIPQMQPMHRPMMLIKPSQVAFALES